MTSINNQAINSGGFLFVKLCNNLDISNSYFKNNTALLMGGAFYLFLIERAEITNTTFSKNMAM